MIIILKDIQDETLHLKNKFMRWMFNDTIGTIDLMRSDLNIRFKSKKFNFKSFDGTKIDG
jgi:hypothetical protein